MNNKCKCKNKECITEKKMGKTTERIMRCVDCGKSVKTVNGDKK